MYFKNYWIFLKNVTIKKIFLLVNEKLFLIQAFDISNIHFIVKIIKSYKVLLINKPSFLAVDCLL